MNETTPMATPNSPYQPQPKQIKQKLTVDTSTKDIIFLLLSVISSFLLMRLGFIGFFNLGFSVAYVILLAVSLIYSFNKNAENKAFYIITSLIAVAMSVSFVFNTDDLIKFFDFLFLVFLTFLSVNGLSGNIHSKDGSLILIPDVLFTAVIPSVENIPVPFRSFSRSAKDGKQKTAFGVLIGLAVSLPILAVILPLLSSADFAFDGLIQNIFSDIFLIIVCVIFTLIFTPIFFSYIFTSSRHGELSKSKVNWNTKFGNVLPSVTNTVLSVISAAYILYLFSQLAYITKAFSFLLPSDFTKAEFARRGFFEMAVIVFINLLIIAVFSIITKRGDKKSLPVLTKILLTFINVFSLFFTISAFSRMAQYIDAYGLTRLRVLTSVFMIMLFLILITVLIKLYVNKFKYIRPIIVICALTLISVSFVNIDSEISKYNYDLYINKGVEIDVDCLGGLGDSAIPELLKLCESKDTEIRDKAYSYLYDYYCENFAREESENKIDALYNEFEEYNVISRSTEKLFIDYAESHKDFIKTIENNPNYSTYTDF